MHASLNSDSPVVIAISPSGAYYGSEQMLHEHLVYTNQRFEVYVKTPGKYLNILRSAPCKHRIIGFNNVLLLYVRVFIRLLFQDIHAVYVNEAGHIRYIKALAMLFPSRKFVVHFRLFEDTQLTRIRNHIPQNVQCICVSHFIEDELKKNNPLVSKKQVSTVHDYYLPGLITESGHIAPEIIKIGIIGRVCTAKGISKANELLSFLDATASKEVECYFYGDVIDDADVRAFRIVASSFKRVRVHLMGFVQNKDDIFGSFDIVLHLNASEPFPRVYFDAMARLKPVVGFNRGGVAEQAHLFGFERNLVPIGPAWVQDMADKIIEIHTEINEQRMDIYRQRHLFTEKLNIDTYMKNIEKHF